MWVVFLRVKIDPIVEEDIGLFSSPVFIGPTSYKKAVSIVTHVLQDAIRNDWEVTIEELTGPNVGLDEIRKMLALRQVEGDECEDEEED